MKTSLSIVCLSLISLNAAGVEVSHTLTEIHLYQGGGEAIRQVDVDPGFSGPAMDLPRLPSGVSSQGISISILQGEGLELGSVELQQVSPQEMPVSPEMKALQNEAAGLRQKLEDLQASIDQSRNKAKTFGKIRDALLDALSEGEGESSVERIWEMEQGQQAAQEEAKQLERSLHDEISGLEKELDQVTVRIEELTRIEESLTYRLRIEVIRSATGLVKLEVRTPLNNVGWRPHYRLNGHPDAGQLDLEYRAELINSTGEAWEDVPLTLFTGQPNWRTEAPEVPPVYLEKPQPVVLYEASARGAMLQSKAAADAPAMETERLTTQFRLEPPHPVSVEAFNSSKLISLATFSSPATFWSVVAPAIEESAYLHAKGEIESDWPILPGEAVLMLDGAFSGNAWLQFLNPGESLELGFGENPNLVVENRELSIKARDSGLFDKVRRYQRHYQAEIKNLMPVAHKVEVRSRFPVSRDEEIEVRRLEPTGLEVDPETGRFSWEQSIPPGGSVKLNTRFEVIAPQDWDIPQQF